MCLIAQIASKTIPVAFQKATIAEIPILLFGDNYARSKNNTTKKAHAVILNPPEVSHDMPSPPVYLLQTAMGKYTVDKGNV
jgi:hypothetical protein